MNEEQVLKMIKESFDKWLAVQAATTLINTILDPAITLHDKNVLNDSINFLHNVVKEASA